MKKINDLSVYTYGNPDNQAIIFAHGFMFDNTMWNKQVEKLKEQYYCVTYDFRGFGTSLVGDGVYTMEGHVDDLYTIMDELKLKKPVLVGLSMGGYMGFRAVERDQNRFAGAIFCDTRATADKNEAKLKRANAIKTINTEGLAVFADTFIPTTVSPNFIKQKNNLFQSLLQNAKKCSPLGTKGCTIAMQGRTDTWSFLPDIRIPTMLLCGEHDALTPIDEMRTTSEQIPDCEFVVIKNSGHMTPIEQPEAVTKAIESFMVGL